MDRQLSEISAKSPAILLVEDELTIALDLESSLGRFGFDVLGLAQTGQQALDMTAANTPDLVLMDVHLAGQMDGIAAAALIRDRYGLPVVFLTANTDSEVIARARSASAYGFLTKPFRMEELNGTIRMALHHHQRTQTLLREHAWLTTMLASLGDGVIATDAGGTVQYLNGAAEAMTGWTLREASGKSIEEVYPLTGQDGVPVERCQLRKALVSREAVGKQRFSVTAKDGTTFSAEDSATPIVEKGRLLGAVTIFQDITQREKAEGILREREKLAIVGRLASSISHEINNPLEAITNLLYLAEGGLASNTPVLSYIRQANEELGRITHITTETLRFHRQRTRPTKTQLTSILDSVLTLHGGRLRNLQVSVEKRYQPCCPLVVFANEIKQVLANLVGNAVDAMVGSRERRLVLKVRDATDWRTGKRGVRVLVADTGVGMSPATKKQLFKAFFTTKPATGTGLGLWVSADLVKKHGGWFKVRSTEDPAHRGTVFSMFLPVPENNSSASQKTER